MFEFSEQQHNTREQSEWTQLGYEIPVIPPPPAFSQWPGQQWVTQVPPMLPPEVTQHHHTQSAPLELPSHPVVAPLQNHQSSVRPARGRGRGEPWTEAEHRLFLEGLHIYGKGKWKSISRFAVQTKTSTQVASHAQKYFRRQNSSSERKKRKSIHDISLEHTNVVPPHVDLQNSTDLTVQQSQEMLWSNPPTPHVDQQNSTPYPDLTIQQSQEILWSDPPTPHIDLQNSTPRPYITIQQSQEMLWSNPPTSHVDLQNSTPHPNLTIQQLQEMLWSNPPTLHVDPQNSTPHPDLTISQEMLRSNPPNNMTHQPSEFEYFDNTF